MRQWEDSKFLPWFLYPVRHAFFLLAFIFPFFPLSLALGNQRFYIMSIHLELDVMTIDISFFSRMWNVWGVCVVVEWCQYIFS